MRFRQLAVLMIVLLAAGKVLAVTPLPAEMAEAGRWSAGWFDGKSIEPTQASGLLVLENHDRVQLNARGGEPLRIGSQTYTNGLYCHAPSRVVVQLPKAGKSFSAQVGIDSRAGGGSVEFIVHAGGKEIFRSGITKIDTPPRLIDLPLGGFVEFTLQATDGGDGISSDQANWADAIVTFNDGSTLRLGDLPLLNAPKAPVPTTMPISFKLNGRPSSEFFASWPTTRSSANGIRTVSATDPQTKLTVRCEAVEFSDSPVVEWTVHFKNEGQSDSPIIEDIRAIDAAFTCAELHTIDGDDCKPESYMPRTDTIPASYQKHIANTGGRPTQIAFPCFNFATPGEGVIVALGWPGQWSADLSSDNALLHIRAGQELTHFTLHPGEEVRGPRGVALFYRGDWIRGQNLWRRWMVQHNMPHPNGKPVAPMNTLCTGNFYPGLMSNAKQELEFLRQHIAGGMKFDAWWQDAGWYPCDGVTWPKTGTWEVDSKRFPKGLREVSDFVHQNKMKSIVWFEPERVYEGTWLAENHPEWIHGGKKGGLLRMDIPECRAWLTDHIDHLLTEQGIDVYRQDFNIDPLPAWRAADAPDRQGITEIRHIEGYLAYFDELLKRHPGMFIDSCSSGGRRNDIETLRRAVPLLRSDWYNSPAGQQCHTYGLALWVPYQGTGFLYSGRDAYWIRSSTVAELTFAPDSAGMAGADLKLLKQMADEHRRIGDAFLADFYPLTPYTLSEDVWMAWQYDQPEAGGGVVQVFRRDRSIYESARLRLHGLDPDSSYTFEDADSHESKTLRGQDVIDNGIPITLTARPGSALVFYQRAGR